MKQVRGMPMGGLVSAGLAQIDASRMEHEGRKKWHGVDNIISVWRFRDDIRVLLRGQVDEVEVFKIVHIFGKLYGPTLGIKYEGSGHVVCHFLDCLIVTGRDRFWIADNNKNVDWLFGEERKGKVRWPSRKGAWEKGMFIRTMIGALKSLRRRVTHRGLLYVGFAQIVAEWKLLAYPDNWIREAAGCVDEEMRHMSGYILKTN